MKFNAFLTSRNSKRWVVCGVGLMLLSALAFANIFGAIQTTTSGGTTVDGNIYADKSLVYLNGGPQNGNAHGLPDGTYYFQVTDPSGGTRLSSDDISCRELTVTNGVVSGSTGTCPHANGTQDPGDGAIPVQLIPYDDTPNTGGEYKVWLTPIGSYDVANCSAGGGSFGFCNSNSKTDNFKVLKSNDPCIVNGAVDLINCPVLWPISGVKFYDTNGNGVQDPGEPGIQGWQINLYMVTPILPVPAINGFPMFTDASGGFNTDNNPAADKPAAGGVYGVCETMPAPGASGFKWTAAPACPNSFKSANFNYGGTYSDTLNPDVTFGTGPYSLQYPVTATGGLVVNFPHLGTPYATCAAGYYTNIDDVFEIGGPHTYGGSSTFNDLPSTGLPVFTDGTNLSDSSWNGAFPGAVFGNYCKNTPAGGLTKGFWSNNNGSAVLGNVGGSAVVDALTDPSTPSSGALHFVSLGLNLNCSSVGGAGTQVSSCSSTGSKNAAYLSGAPFTGNLPCSTTAYTCLDYWLTNGSNSSNAAMQLSVQMTAAVLNIVEGNAIVGGGFVSGPPLTVDTYIYAPGTNCAAAANVGGYAKLGCVINEANTVLGMQQSDGKFAYTPSGSTAKCSGAPAATGGNCRSWETLLQTALNNANNNIAGPTPGPATGIALCGVNYTDGNGNPVAACTLP